MSGGESIGRRGLIGPMEDDLPALRNRYTLARQAYHADPTKEKETAMLEAFYRWHGARLDCASGALVEEVERRQSAAATGKDIEK